MNPPSPKATSPIRLLRSMWSNRQLIVQMTEREILGRYRGSILGMVWSFLSPLIMLVVYTFVFSAVFKARWGTDGDETKTQFAVVLFVGLIIHGFFAEVLGKSPTTIISNTNYVKKVIFPLEILPIINVGAALFHVFISSLILLLAFYFLNGFLHWTVIFTPFVLLPFIILTLGLSWFISSLGVFLRDISQIISVVIVIAMFLSPVLFPISTLPEEYHALVMANPLTLIINQARDVIIWGNSPDWKGLGIYTMISILFAWLGFAWFQKTRKGFADVL